MGILSKTITAAFGAVGLVVFSQAPEFAQQYRQRLGGAVDELGKVVAEFDLDARSLGLERGEAIEALNQSGEPLPRKRGETMGRTILRFERLSHQQELVELSGPLMRPVHVFTRPDMEIAREALGIFEPAVPLNLPGAAYGGFGALLGLLLARLMVAGGRGLRREKPQPLPGVGKPAGPAGRIRVTRNEEGIAPEDFAEGGGIIAGDAYARRLEAAARPHPGTTEVRSAYSAAVLPEGATSFEERYRGEVGPDGSMLSGKRPQAAGTRAANPDPDGEG